MNAMDLPVQAPVDHPDADTEWNDILRRQGIIPEKPPDPEPIIQEALIEAKKLAHENRLEGKDLEELNELEDEEDEDFLDRYRKQRLNELSNIARSSIYNQVFPLQKIDYARDVTEVSQISFVVVLMTSSTGTNYESAVLSNLWPQLAEQFGDIKFCEIRANLCVEGYPDQNTPTVLIYKDGDIKRQIVTLKELNGTQTNLQDLQRVLISVGALKQNNTRLHKTEDAREPQRDGVTWTSKTSVIQNGDEDDWD